MRTNRSSVFTDAAGVPRRPIGREYVHIAIDDATRLAYVEVLADEKAPTAVGFLRHAVKHRATYGIIIERLITDNGTAYISTIHAIACRALRIRHLRTRPYRPQELASHRVFPYSWSRRMVLADWALRGRDTETALLGGLLRAAGGGRSGALVLRGEPGIGKTALLEFAIGAAEHCRVLRARGLEPESQIAFAGLQELFGPVVARLDGLPDRQRAMLAGALALGPPVRGDPLAVGAATLSLLAAAAEDRPVLAVIDDAHWLDLPSAEALAFAARRLQSEGIVVLFAMRVAEPSAFDPTGLAVLEVMGLAENSAREVLADRVGTEDAAAVVRTVVGVAGGNPLALAELAGMLSAAELSGREPLAEPLLVGSGLERAFARRLAPLSDETRAALLIAAASAQDESGTITRALRTRGLSPAAFEPAERAGLITIADGVVRFYHSLLRSVIYQGASGDQRRAAHAALAVASEETVDRCAWHLAAACVGPDEHVAAALDEAAGRALARGGLSTAAHTYARAAGLSANTEAGCRRLLAAANLAFASGRPEWAAALADTGLPLAAVASTRADFEHLAAAAERNLGSMSRARSMLWDGANRIAGEDPARAVAMLLDATLTDFMGGDLSLEPPSNAPGSVRA